MNILQNDSSRGGLAQVYLPNSQLRQSTKCKLSYESYLAFWDTNYEIYFRVLSAAACATGTRPTASSTASLGRIATSEDSLSARISSHPQLRINSKCGLLKVRAEKVRNFCNDSDFSIKFRLHRHIDCALHTHPRCYLSQHEEVHL